MSPASNMKTFIKNAYDLHVFSIFQAVPNTKYTATAVTQLKAMDYGGEGDGYEVEVEYDDEYGGLPQYFYICTSARHMFSYMKTIKMNGLPFECSSRGLQILSAVSSVFEYEVQLLKDPTSCSMSNTTFWQHGYDAIRAIFHSSADLIGFMSQPWLDTEAYNRMMHYYHNIFAIHMNVIQSSCGSITYTAPRKDPAFPLGSFDNYASVTQLAEYASAYSAKLGQPTFGQMGGFWSILPFPFPGDPNLHEVEASSGSQ
jgi:hypothetical protein